MSFMDIFRTPAPAASAAGSQTVPSGGAKSGTGDTPNNTSKPNAEIGAEGNSAKGAPGSSTEGEKSPLDPFSSLWEDDPKKSSTKKPYLTIDPAKVKESAKKLQYSNLVPSDLASKALSGDVASLNQILDTVGQAGFTSAFSATQNLIERAMQEYDTRMSERLPSEVRRHTAADATFAENPKLKHPSIQPLIRGVQSQLESKFPDASAADIQRMTSEYMSGALELLTGPDSPSGKKKAAETKKDTKESFAESLQPKTNWDDFFGTGT